MNPLWQTLAIWAAAFGAIACWISTIRLIRTYKVVEEIWRAQIHDLTEAHHAEVAVLTVKIERLDHRIVRLEGGPFYERPQ